VTDTERASESPGAWTLRAVRAVEQDRAEWEAFIAARPEADVLQSWAWGEVVEEAGKAPGVSNREVPERLVVRDAVTIRAVAQVLVRRTSFGRSILYVPRGPIWDRAAADAAAVLDAVAAGLREVARETRGIVVKVDPRAVVTGPADDETDADMVAVSLRDRGFRDAPLGLQARSTRIIDIEPDEATRIAAWSGEARNRWRRGLKEGTTTTVSRGADPEAIDAFLGLLGPVAARAGFRTRPDPFYRSLAERFAATHGLHLAIARHDGRPIAGMFVIGVGGRAFYLYGASDHDAPRHAYGSYSAMAAVLEALAEDGVRTLDVWGVAEPGDPDPEPGWAGFSEFKIRFDGRPLRHPGTFDVVTDPLWFTIRRVRERLGGAG
jgi:lipid II:glycine glycyltransferase (peptidoglycan interpeptide bridge formation enzyme)